MSCSTYAVSFGYEVYLVPVAACGVDFSVLNGGIQGGGFIDPTAPLASSTQILAGTPGEILAGDPGSNIVFDNDIIVAQTTLALTGLTNAAIETDTGSESVQTYDFDSLGFDKNVALSKSWTMTLEGKSQFGDAGYKVMRLLELGAVSGGLKCKIGRIGPTGTTEKTYGYATLTNYSESVEAGSVVSWSCEAQGYGPAVLELDNG